VIIKLVHQQDYPIKDIVFDEGQVIT